MSYSALCRSNRGAYTSPFSGVGVEFFPLGMPTDHAGFVLYETGYLPHNDWWNFPNVLSPFWRLYYNAKSGHKVVFQQREFALTPEHLMLIPDGQFFHCHGSTPVPSLWFAFNVARRLTPEQQIPVLLPVGRMELAMIHHVTGLFSGDAGEQNRDRIFHGSMALLHVALSRPEIQWQRHTPASVVQTVQYIEDHFASPLLIPRLAKMTHISVETLARAFKKYQGETIGQFIMKVRVREAAHLLRHTDEKIETIAERTGFPNRSYLSRVFKNATGESPAEFRHRHMADSSVNPNEP